MGKEFALELARKGFNMVLISRNPNKLSHVAQEIKKINP
jgi:17beta-estradiol 17-dehydrogenase / very-long-chain 3-oxoacyl-CoA reductase